jgi:hypothetical protein
MKFFTGFVTAYAVLLTIYAALATVALVGTALH